MIEFNRSIGSGPVRSEQRADLWSGDRWASRSGLV